MTDALTIRQLKNTIFFKIYCNAIIDPKNIAALLPLAILLLNFNNNILKQLGYSIILRYSNYSNDYIPLYETAFNLGLFPICRIIYKDLFSDNLDKTTFMGEWLESFINNAKINNQIKTIEQVNLLEFYSDNIDNDICLIAPTSYGKSETIIGLLREITEKNLCILVPTKALITQTRNLLNKHLKEFGDDFVIITHPDMFLTCTDDRNIVAIFTQERLIRFINQYRQIHFDYLVVDEAHELLEKNKRSYLTAIAILSLKNINKKLAIKFLTPFVSNSKSLDIEYSNISLNEYKVDEVVKVPRYKYIDLISSKNYIYDQFFNDFIQLPANLRDNLTPEEFILKNKNSIVKEKVLVYLNKSKDLEQCALNLAKGLDPVVNSSIDEICEALQVYFHADYNLIKCLKHGVLYHHGSMPDNVRTFVEHIYSSIIDIKYLVTSSTLMQGVNLPIDEIYILDPRKGIRYLTASSFKNLVGRVCRFKEIFSGSIDKLKLLESSIYILNCSYCRQKSNLPKFLRNVADVNKDISDEINNQLLKNYKKERNQDFKLLQDVIENTLPGTIDNFTRPPLKTRIGKICAQNAFDDFDLYQHEEAMQNYCSIYEGKINNVKELIEAILDIFIKFLPQNKVNQSLRLLKPEVQSFYCSLISKRINNASYKELIQFYLRYWKYKRDNQLSSIVYVGHKWGNISQGSRSKCFININKLSDSDLINLAIVRIKEEEDFIDLSIIRYVEILKQVGLLKEDLYLKLKYGTENRQIIELIQLGLSPSISRTIVEEFSEYIEYTDNLISGIDKGIIKAFQNKGYDIFKIFEVKSKL